MKKFKDSFNRALSYLRQWYRERMVRRVFLIAIAAALFCLILAQFGGAFGNAMGYGAMLCCIVALGASVGDTWMSSKDFKQGIKDMQQQYFVRMVETYGEQMGAAAPPCFSPQDLKQIKKKKMQYRGSILIKLLFIGFLIFFFISSLV